MEQKTEKTDDLGWETGTQNLADFWIGRPNLRTFPSTADTLVTNQSRIISIEPKREIQS